MVEYLDKVKSLYNTDTYTVLDIETNKDKYRIRLPYVIIESQKGDRYGYSMGVNQWCKLHGIITKEYFKILHKDTE